MLGKKVLLAKRGVVAAVCRYAPGERHGRHTDRHSRISFLLHGGYREEGRTGAMTMRPGDVLLKSRRAKHEDEFSENGAAIASLEFIDDDPFDAGADPDLWRRRADAFALSHAMTFLEAALAGDMGAAAMAGVDLVESASEITPRRRAPPWLQRLGQELEQTSLAAVDVAAQARAAGAHPAHASRLFRQCYGVSITEHAQAQSVRRAIGGLADPRRPLSQVAIAAGFYDQSHMNRVFRRITGRTPGAHRDMFTRAAR